jgi:hypothetical protein
METPKRMIPYAVHLPEDIYNKMKDAAKERKASAIVRDAITMIVEGDSVYTTGYKKGVKESIDVVLNNDGAKTISYGKQTIADSIASDLGMLLK